MLQAQGKFWASDLDRRPRPSCTRRSRPTRTAGSRTSGSAWSERWRHDYPGRARRGGGGSPPRRSAGAPLGAAPPGAALPRARVRRQRHRHISRAPCSTIATTSTAGSGWARRWSTTPDSAARRRRTRGRHSSGWPRSTARSRRSTTTWSISRSTQATAQAASTFLAPRPAGPSLRPAKVAEVQLRFGPPTERAAALAALRTADRQAISEAVIVWAHGAFDLGLADTAATFLLGADRLPDDRLRGAQYRLVTQAALGRWAEGYAAWDSVAGRSRHRSPGWCRRSSPAFRRAHTRRRCSSGPVRDATRAARRISRSRHGSEPRQGFEALVYRAVVEGDSAETGELLRRIDRAPPPAPSEPSADALRWSLRARLALLAHDTTAAVAALRRAVARIAETYTANYPAHRGRPAALPAGPAAPRPGRLGRARSAGAARSPARGPSADLFYLPALDSLGPARPTSQECSMSTRTASPAAARHDRARHRRTTRADSRPSSTRSAPIPDERFYMLATFCFDLSRKLKYITLALQEYYRRHAAGVRQDDSRSRSLHQSEAGDDSRGRRWRGGRSR